AEVSKRYQFLSEQMQDAETAKRELEDLITSLTEEMQQIFSESFSVIDRNFQEIFKDLFGGGEARLELTDPEHVLESGIEIKVAPPGKVIKNLISLSGGEQSFVAIAIYFAILRLRPSPFCILDEIDAALDEGNVRRYAQYLQNFTDTTQFILVTHRRSAMEEASVLYGVTMQEDGISRLLRMEQEELQKDRCTMAYLARRNKTRKGVPFWNKNKAEEELVQKNDGAGKPGEESDGAFGEEEDIAAAAIWEQEAQEQDESKSRLAAQAVVEESNSTRRHCPGTAGGSAKLPEEN
ncbi:MAG: hypothetical protein ACLT29_08425, partial [Ruminococcus callidus]